MERVRWGILGTADIAERAVIPGLRKSGLNEVGAVASRDASKAKAFAARVGIPRACSSYEELLADPEISAVYIPLPNNLHVEWTCRALEAGKHVLCEKPVGMNAGEATRLLECAASHPHLKVMEAFMYRLHPQWERARELVVSGAVGKLQTVESFFSYYKTDPDNVRNRPETGGGGLLDIGCYCISASRFLFDEEPERVLGLIEYDRELGIDRLASAILDFPSGQASFTCATQLAPYQRVNALGSDGRIEVERPFNAYANAPVRVRLERGQKVEEESFVADQYELQGEAFARAVLEGGPVPTPLQDALQNMKVIDAVFESSRSGGWVTLE